MKYSKYCTEKTTQILILLCTINEWLFIKNIPPHAFPYQLTPA